MAPSEFVFCGHDIECKIGLAPRSDCFGLVWVYLLHTKTPCSACLAFGAGGLLVGVASALLFLRLLNEAGSSPMRRQIE